MTAEQKLSHGMICTIPFAVIRSLRGDVVKSLPALIVIKLRDRLGGELP